MRGQLDNLFSLDFAKKGNVSGQKSRFWNNVIFTKDCLATD